MNKEIHVLSPATVSNVSCGFDILGLCLDTVGDEIRVKTSSQKGIRITHIEGFDLPLETHKNVAGVSATALVEDLKPNCGFEIEIIKHIKPGSGIGSSAASAAGSVFAINELMGRPYNLEQLTQFALKGEAIASQSEHADNLAPAIYGGCTLVKSLKPLEVLNIPVPDQMFAVVVHPQIEIKTAEARSILPKEVSLENAILQCSNIGSFIHGMHTSNFELIKRSIHDALVEPYRRKLIPHFDEVKNAAMSAKAIGLGISGSGPSIFALAEGFENAVKVEKAMRKVYNATSIQFETYLSKINTEGIKIKDLK